MARSISDEEIKLRGKARRRLVGAIALVAIVTAFLPMVLDNQPKPLKQDIAIDIPKPESGGFSAPIMPPPAPPAVSQDAVMTPPKAAVMLPVPAKAPETPAAIEPPQPESAPKAEAKATPKPAAAADKSAPKAAATHSAKEGFVVQLGAFSQAANAKQLQTKLKDADIKSFTDVLKTASGEKIRVRAGPFASREEAEKAQAKLKKMGLKGNVVSAD